MRHFKNVIVRIPGKGISEGITSNPDLGKPVHKNALVQHENYVAALSKCGVKVNVLPPNDEFPDSCFMEDTALCTDKCAIISRPGAETRRDETQLEDFRKMLSSFYTNVHEIKAPGLVEPGDIMMGWRYFLCWKICTYKRRRFQTNERNSRKIWKNSYPSST